jgi:hypothetical protein
VNREEFAMNRIAFAAVSLAVLSACAPDTHGDLRELVAIHPPGAASRMTFAGRGPGSGPGAFEATFGEDWLPTFVADFGTTLKALKGSSAAGGDSFTLLYEGNPVALARLAARWREVFDEAGADCADRSCFWTEDGEMLATLYIDRRWHGLVAEVHVSLLR